MKRFVATVSIVICFGFIAAALAQDGDYFKTQGEVMECSPPKIPACVRCGYEGRNSYRNVDDRATRPAARC